MLSSHNWIKNLIDKVARQGDYTSGAALYNDAGGSNGSYGVPSEIQLTDPAGAPSEIQSTDTVRAPSEIQPTDPVGAPSEIQPTDAAGAHSEIQPTDPVGAPSEIQPTDAAAAALIRPTKSFLQFTLLENGGGGPNVRA